MPLNEKGLEAAAKALHFAQYESEVDAAHEWESLRASKPYATKCAGAALLAYLQHAGEGEAEPVAWACMKCNSPRSVDPCPKCGTPLTKPADGWDWPRTPDVAHIRALAREVGYAIGVHGTQERDLDLIAAPWVAEAVTPLELAQHIAAGLGGSVLDYEQQDKPCGRWSCNINSDGWFKLIDLSVMPPAAPPELAETVSRYGKALRSMQEAAGLAIESLPADQQVGTVGDFLATIHRHCASALSCGHGGDFAAPHPHQAPESWQPITDKVLGPVIVCHFGDAGHDWLPMTAYRAYGSGWLRPASRDGLPYEPTHWMPLPASPSSADQGGE